MPEQNNPNEKCTELETEAIAQQGKACPVHEED